MVDGLFHRHGLVDDGLEAEIVEDAHLAAFDVTDEGDGGTGCLFARRFMGRSRQRASDNFTYLWNALITVGWLDPWRFRKG